MININILNKINLIRKNKKTIGLCHGVFDLLHYGHLLHFEAAKKKCDYLFVSITSDKFVNKGPNRPVHNDSERIHILKNLKFIDFVFIAKGESGVNSIDLIKPDFYFKGSDYKNNSSDKTKKILKEISAVKKNKGKIIYTNEKEMSSSSIISKLDLALNEKQTKFLKLIKKSSSYESIVNSLNKIKKDKVLVIGDLIIDKYIFGRVLGKSGKEPHMVFSKAREECYIGGSSIIANHLSDFINNITLISDFSPDNEIKNILNKMLKKNIKHIKIQPSKDYKSCIKARFIDSINNYKLFGSYRIPNLQTPNFYKSLNKNLELSLYKNDIVIIADYSNNFFDLKSLEKIKKSKKFIGAMAQKNSNDAVFHSLSHLKNFDLLCINEGELRSEIRDSKSDIDLIAKSFLKKNNLKYIIVTKGINGATLFDYKLNKYSCPSFNTKPLDKMGAGDSMLAVLCVLLKNKINPYISLLIASLVSSIVVNNIGNAYSASKIEIERNLEFLLK